LQIEAVLDTIDSTLERHTDALPFPGQYRIQSVFLISSAGGWRRGFKLKSFIKDNIGL
jgi:hypothetical protein